MVLSITEKMVTAAQKWPLQLQMSGIRTSFCKKNVASMNISCEKKIKAGSERLLMLFNSLYFHYLKTEKSNESDDTDHC